ncbi:MAG: hypothetical protein AAF587_34265 [Bacteroidota bacterium]
MRKVAFLISLFACLLVASSCGPSDLSLINEVKRFEPEWMNLSEKVSFINQHLRITHRRYEQDLNEVNPFISDPGMAERSNLLGMRSAYKNMMTERDELETRFQDQRLLFIQTVEDFNDWQTKLMKDKISNEDATQGFADFKAQHDQLFAEMTTIEKEVVKNIEKHNALLRRITSALKLYTNYDIVVAYQ